MTPYEREISTRVAKKRLYEAYQECGYKMPYLKKLARGRVYLALNPETKSDAQGAGKGKFSHLGALAESLEHKVYENYSPPVVQDMSVADIRAQNFFEKDPTIQSLSEFDALSMKCSPWRCDEAFVWMPEALVQTNFGWRKSKPEQVTARYATNSGAAYGSTFQEAVLHCVLEVVERDFISALLFAVLNGSEVDGLIRIEPQIATDFETYYILSHRGVAVAVCIESNAPYRSLPAVASGASFDPRHAVERATSEFLQLKTVADEDTRDEDSIVLKNLNQSDVLKKLVHPAPQQCIAGPTPAQIDEPFETLWSRIKVLLKDLGFAIRVLYQGKSGQHIVQVYSPILSRFNLIRQGSIVAPLHFGRL